MRRDMRISVNRDVCIGAGQCVLTAGAVFDQDDQDGLVRLLTESPAEGEWGNVRQAASVCPARVISVVDTDGED
jgi:ferredoxin